MQSNSADREVLSAASVLVALFELLRHTKGRRVISRTIKFLKDELAPTTHLCLTCFYYHGQGSTSTHVQEEVVRCNLLATLKPIFNVIVVDPSLLHEAVVARFLRSCVDFCLALIGHVDVNQEPTHFSSIKQHVPQSALEVYVQTVYDTNEVNTGNKKQTVRMWRP